MTNVPVDGVICVRTNFQRAIMGQLLGLNKKTGMSEVDRYVEYELTANERPRLSEAQASEYERRMNRYGFTSLHVDQRWDLYRHWHLAYLRELEESTEDIRAEYR